MTSTKNQPLSVPIPNIAYGWSDGPVWLRYCLGDLNLFEVRFSGKHTSLCNEADHDAAVLGPFSRDTTVYCVRDCVLRCRLPRIRRSREHLQYTINQCDRYYIDMAGTFAEYLGSLSAKTRSTVKRKVRQFLEFAGQTKCFTTYRTATDMKAFQNRAREIAVKTYQEKLFDGAIPGGSTFCEHLQALAARDRARGYILSAENQAIAYLYCPVSDTGVVRYAYLGYDPAYSQRSPGTVLLYLALDSLFAEQRFRIFDFEYGYNQTKAVFCTAKSLHADVFYFQKTVRNQAAVYVHAAMDSVSASVGRGLDKVRLRGRIKRLLRSA